MIPKWSKEPQNVIATLNKEINLECDSKAYPKPMIRWFKLGEKGK